MRNSRLIARRNCADVVLGDDVEADGRLVEKQQRRIVQQRRRQIAAHALAQREFAHRRVQIIANAKNLIEVLHARVEIALRNVVDAAQQLERFDHGDIPPELRALPENHADGLHVVPALAKRNKAVDANFARSRHQNAGEHLDAGGFSRAVRPDVADHFAAVDGKADAVDSARRCGIRGRKGFGSSPKRLPGGETRGNASTNPER